MHTKVVFLLSTLLVMTLSAQRDQRVNPFTSPADEAEGKRTFRMRCARCHGIDGTGWRGPDLTSGHYRHGDSDSDLFENILMGIPNTGMPHHTLPEKRIWQTVAYLRAVARQPSRVTLQGDAGSGERLFRGKGDCNRCHRVAGSGGRLGPDLSDVGWRRTPDQLRASILEPDEVVSGPYRAVRLRERSGRVVRGLLLNQDSYSVQVMDLQENLLSLWKRDLLELEQESTSLMPGYGRRLTSSEVEDLVAYLYSLRERRAP